MDVAKSNYQVPVSDNRRRTVRVALVGNPNSGKTTLSNLLTGAHDSVGNYPRVTHSVAEHLVEHRGWRIRLYDLPGMYSLTSESPEERIGRDFLERNRPDLVVNVLDGGNLERSLYLTSQLIELGLPRVYALNMADEMHDKGQRIDRDAFSDLLGGPVVETVSNRGRGANALLDAIVRTLDQSGDRHWPIRLPYDVHVEKAISRVEERVRDLHPGAPEAENSRWLAIKLLEGNTEALNREGDHRRLIEEVGRERARLARSHGEEAETLFADSRYGFIHGLLSEARQVTIDPARRLDFTRRLDRVLLHRGLGLPMFLGLMWVMFEATFTLGQIPMDWIDAGVRMLSDGLDSILPAGLARDLLIDGVVAGVGGTIIFLPNIVILFLFMAFFSESGYLSRSAFLIDRLMHAFGLHGKAFIPLVMGFGCNVPAIMASRTIESPRARLVAILVNPFMSCTARLPVFILFGGAFFAEMAGTMVFAMYMLSIVVAMLAAVVLSKLVVRGGDEPFVMELPPYRLPTLKAVLYHMWEKARNFLKKVTGIILAGSVIIWFLQAFPQPEPVAAVEPATNQAVAAADATAPGPVTRQVENSYLGRIGHGIQPILAPLGFGWQETVAILTGLVAKEVVVASLAVLHAEDRDADANSQGLRTAIAGTLTPAAALAFMVFVLLYSPCLSTIAVIRSETGSWRWAGFSVLFSLTVAWSLAFVVATVGGLIA